MTNVDTNTLSKVGTNIILVRKKPFDSPQKFSETDVVNMLDFLIDSIFVLFGGCVFQQSIGIHMGTNCAPLLVDLFLYA
jgi:hypothetical protein